MAKHPDRLPRPQVRQVIPAVHIPEDEGQGRFNQEMQAAVQKLMTNPILSGVTLNLDDFDLTSGTAKPIAHGLGRVPVGMLTVYTEDTVAPRASEAPDDVYVYVIVNNATLTSHIYVF